MTVGLDTTALLNLFQPEFGERVQSYMNERTHVYNRFSLSPRRFDGKNTVEAIMASVPGSFGFYGPSMPSLPTPGRYSTTTFTVTHAYCAASVSVDWDTIAETSGPEAFAEAWSLSMERTNIGMLLTMERIACSDGSGVLNPLLAVLDSGASGTVSTTGGINTAAGTATLGASLSATAAGWSFAIHTFDSPKIEIGTRLQFWAAPSAGVLSQSTWRNATMRDVPSQNFYTVSNVEPDGPAGATPGIAKITITEASPGTNPPLAGDFIAMAGAIAQDATSSTTNAINEMIGIDGHVSNTALFLQPNTKAGFTADDTHQGVSLTSNGRWVSPTVSAASGFLTQPILENLAMRMNIFGSAEADQANFYLSHPFQIRKYREELYPQERYMVSNDTPSLPTGSKSTMSEQRYIMFSDLPMIPSRFCRADRTYLLNMNNLKRYQLLPFQFRGVHQDFNNRPADQQDGFGIGQIGCDNRTTSGVVTTLKYSPTT